MLAYGFMYVDPPEVNIMINYYIVVESRSHAFLLEQRFKAEGIACEMAYMPRPIMKELCNLGIKFGEAEFPRAMAVLRKAGLPGCRLYREIVEPASFFYEEVIF